MLANRSIAAAVAWVRKYLVVASTARGWWCWAMRGIMASVLISKPIQASSQCELANVIVVPRPRPNSRRAIMYGFINRGRTLTYMFGAWAQELTWLTLLGSGVEESLRVLISSGGVQVPSF